MELGTNTTGEVASGLLTPWAMWERVVASAWLVRAAAPLHLFLCCFVLVVFENGVLHRGCLHPHSSFTYFFFGDGFYFLFYDFYVLILLTPLLLISATRRPDSVASPASGSQEGVSPPSALLPPSQPGNEGAKRT